MIKKIKPLTIVAIAIMAISISTLDFNNLNWDNNQKNYLGLIAFAVLISFDLYLRKNKA